MLEILVARSAGFCAGVRRAVERAEEASARGQVKSLGPLMHNPQEVERLAQAGIPAVGEEQIDDQDVVLVRTHGVPADQLRRLQQRAGLLHDTTCSKVKTSQRIAARMASGGYAVLLVGQQGHAEVDSVLSFGRDAAAGCEDPAPVLLVGQPAELQREELLGQRKVAVLCQTTIPMDRYQAVVQAALAQFAEVRAFNTICGVTARRQAEARELARKADVVVVVGGRDSANTRRLVQVCAAINPRTHHLETAAELRRQWFDGVQRVAVTAGASTPAWLVQQVVQRLKKLYIKPA